MNTISEKTSNIIADMESSKRSSVTLRYKFLYDNKKYSKIDNYSMEKRNEIR